MKGENSVLIVEDDKDVLDVLSDALFLSGYLCETVPSGEEALERFRKTPFAIVITDIALPGMTGLDLAERIKQLSPDTIVITMTGFIDDFDYDKAIEAGASDFIKKPFTFKELLARIKHAKMQEQIRGLLLTDELTGLLNRRGFFALAQQQLKMARREERGLYILYADLDELKVINDMCGHNEGDRALTDVANILKASCREADITARIGGDEFVLLSAGHTDETSRLLIARLRNNLEALNSARNREYRLSVSFGSAYFDPGRPCSLYELLKEADKSMYEYKRFKNISQTKLF